MTLIPKRKCVFLASLVFAMLDKCVRLYLPPCGTNYSWETPPNSKHWFTTPFLLEEGTPFGRDTPRKARLGVWDPSKLQALVYDILPSTTALISYAIGTRKLSANEQFFVGAQTVVSLLQTTQIKQGVSSLAANKVYTSTNKTTIVWIETELFLLPGVDASHVYVCAWALGCFYSHISTRTFRRALTGSLDSCAEIKSAPSVE